MGRTRHGDRSTADKDRIAALTFGLGRLLHSISELIINTLSFIRVGVFALVHAIISGVINNIASNADTLMEQTLILILGHTVAICVESFLVFIQIFRLLLFEFCLRFLKADGRLFRKMDQPGQSNT